MSTTLNDLRPELASCIMRRLSWLDGDAVPELNAWGGTDFALRDGRAIRFTLDEGDVALYVPSPAPARLLVASVKVSTNVDPDMIAAMADALVRGTCGR